MRIVSGMRPTGRLHLGHYFGVIRNWLKLQNEHECYFFVADWHALTTGYKKTGELKSNTEELMADWLALGLDPSKAVLFVQSLVKEHAELYLLLGMLTPKSWLELNPTYKDLKYNLLKLHELKDAFKERFAGRTDELIRLLGVKVEEPEEFKAFLTERLAELLVEALFEGLIEKETLKRLNVSKKEFYETDTYGFLGYPVLQTADVLAYKGEAVPVGEDQLPHLELARELARRFNRLYGPTFPEPKPLLTETPKLPGTDGRKMSKSYGNAVYFADETDELRKKIMSMFTDPQKLRKNDPGHPERCPVFAWHRVFSADEAEQIERECKSGALGCVECKRRLFERVEAFIAPVRERRKELLSDRGELWRVFKEGSEKARQVASGTLKQVREAMNLP
ncbi:MAG: tryptophan--tRNA ligase [Aquificae bacterium]|nr:tryptophan--tRNA ligase [Aquificota bacterium]